MPIRETLTATPATLATVLSNGKRYVVPMFQRDYAWEQDEWSELWADILELDRSTGAPTNHYLGALVLQATDDRAETNIIDGQQRLVTLSLLALAVIVRIERLADSGVEVDDNRERARLLREKFVSTKDPASLQYRSRLRLNGSDNGFYQTYLVQGVMPTRPNGLKGSEARLYQAFRYLDQRVGDHLGAAATGADLARFLEHVVANRLSFIEIRVDDDETAFAVFETLNARGVALGTADLLKNFVFSVARTGGAHDLEQARLLWEQIISVVPMTDVHSLLFHKLASKVPELREKRVFSEVKKRIPKEQTVFEFLRELKDAAEIYAALDDPDSELWMPYPEARRHVRVLKLLKVEQFRPVVLSAFTRFADRPERLTRLLRNLAIISVRAAVFRINTGDLQRAYQATALRIETGELKSPLAITRDLADITPSDDQFRGAFAGLAVDPRGPRKRWLRYLLASLEAAVGGHSIDFEAADATIEHILPDNPGPDWGLFSEEERSVYTTRLGNLTPLEYAINRGLGATSFERKRAAYQQSAYELTRGITAAEWSPAAVRERQGRLADLAVQVWSIDAGD